MVDDIKKHTEVICNNPWISLKKVVKPDSGINGYVFSHETRCNGKIVTILPFRKRGMTEDIEYLARKEITPCWGLQYELSSITGGVEHDDPRDTAVEEMLQEAGYAITQQILIPLGTSYASKSSDSVYYLFSVDLTHNHKVGVGAGDGSELEKVASCEWVGQDRLLESKDPQVSVLFLRLSQKLQGV